MFQIKNTLLEINGETLINVPDINVENGRTIGLIGPNGSGKSTLLHYIKSHSDATDDIITLIPQLKDTKLEKSGGETTKLYLKEAFKRPAGVILLDEPTTHLDENNTDWLYQQLTGINAAMIIVSHDRDFLDKTVDETWAVEDKTLNIYPGNYTKYKEIKANHLKQQQSEYKKYRQEKAHLEEAVENKSRQADRANRVYDKAKGKYITKETPYFNKMQQRLHKVSKGIESRLNQLEEKEKPFEEKAVRFHNEQVQSLGKKTILRMENETLSAGSRTILKDISFYITAGDKVSITGPNGSGKTTFLSRLYEKHKDTSLKIGYFYQKLESLDITLSIIENIMNTSRYSETAVRTMLARLNIKRDDVYKTVSVTSGGERVKVQLVKLLTADHQVLLLDEPTDFLDINTVEAFEEMLTAYPGTIVLVSHDKRFRETVTERSFRIKSARLKEEITVTERDAETDSLMIIENKISEVVGRLSISPTPALEKEFDELIKRKKEIQK